jgi:hypothetical protein
VLINDRAIRVLDHNIGTLVRKLVLDPTRDDQPRGVKCGNSPKNRLHMQMILGTPVNDVPRHHKSAPGRIRTCDTGF